VLLDKVQEQRRQTAAANGVSFDENMVPVLFHSSCSEGVRADMPLHELASRDSTTLTVAIMRGHDTGTFNWTIINGICAMALSDTHVAFAFSSWELMVGHPPTRDKREFRILGKRSCTLDVNVMWLGLDKVLVWSKAKKNLYVVKFDFESRKMRRLPWFVEGVESAHAPHGNESSFLVATRAGVDRITFSEERGIIDCVSCGRWHPTPKNVWFSPNCIRVDCKGRVDAVCFDTDKRQVSVLSTPETMFVGRILPIVIHDIVPIPSKPGHWLAIGSGRVIWWFRHNFEGSVVTSKLLNFACDARSALYHLHFVTPRVLAIYAIYASNGTYICVIDPDNCEVTVVNHWPNYNVVGCDIHSRRLFLRSNSCLVMGKVPLGSCKLVTDEGFVV
jgi:hypothetical protein